MLPPGRGRLYWHVLLGDDPEVRGLASEAQRRLAGIAGLDMTPQRWLHMTVLVVGLSDEVASSQIDAMVSEAARLLRCVAPMSVTLGRVLYHPEAVVVAARPAEALEPLLHSVQAATHRATGQEGVLAHVPWSPHITVAYSSAVQPAAPVMAALGKELSPRRITVRTVSLVNQDGPEYLWEWRPIAHVPVGRPEAPVLV
jgi:2'-5' RNA ligase